MSKKKVIISIVLLILLVLPATIFYNRSHPFITHLELNNFSFYDPNGYSSGLEPANNTFEDYITQHSTDVLLGRVTSVIELPESPGSAKRAYYEFKVEDKLQSNISEDKVYAYINLGYLEKNKEYILLLNENKSTIHPHDFYVVNSDFIFEVDSSKNEVKRLTNPVAKSYIRPFKEDQYNQLDELVKYIKNLKVTGNASNILGYQQTDIKSNAKDLEELYRFSDFIISIKPTSVTVTPGQTAEIVRFDSMEIYKGNLSPSKLQDYDVGLDRQLSMSLVLPFGFERNKEYILFLVSRGDAKPTLATRQDSVISEDHVDYQKVLDFINSNNR